MLSTVVKRNVVEAKLNSNVGTEMLFQLPIGSSHQFIKMFSELDTLVKNQVIINYGVGITTLEEVFLMVAKGESARVFSANSHSQNENCDTEDQNTSIDNVLSISKVDDSGIINSDETKVSVTDNSQSFGTNLGAIIDDKKNDDFQRHVKALFMKRALNFKRDKRAWFCSILLPSFVTLLGFISIQLLSPTREMIPLLLTMNDYNINIVSEEKHVIQFNSGQNFDCNPGTCITSQIEVNNQESGEHYFYCGASANMSRVSSEFDEQQKCIVKSSMRYINEIKSSGIFFLDDKKSSTVLDVSVV